MHFSIKCGNVRYEALLARCESILSELSMSQRPASLVKETAAVFVHFSSFNALRVFGVLGLRDVVLVAVGKLCKHSVLYSCRFDF